MNRLFLQLFISSILLLVIYPLKGQDSISISASLDSVEVIAAKLNSSLRGNLSRTIKWDMTMMSELPKIGKHNSQLAVVNITQE